MKMSISRAIVLEIQPSMSANLSRTLSMMTPGTVPQ